MKHPKHVRLLAILAVVLTFVALTPQSASASSNWSWSTGANASDGHMLMAINLQVNSGFCEGIDDGYYIASLAASGLADCNVDSTAVAAVVVPGSGSGYASTISAGQIYHFRVCKGYYFNGYWQATTNSNGGYDCTGDLVTNQTA